MATVFLYVNFILAISAVFIFLNTSKHIGSPMKYVFWVLSFNCSIMVILYLLIILGYELPDITGRLNLTLILLSLNASGWIAIRRRRPE